MKTIILKPSFFTSEFVQSKDVQKSAGSLIKTFQNLSEGVTVTQDTIQSFRNEKANVFTAFVDLVFSCMIGRTPYTAKSYRTGSYQKICLKRGQFLLHKSAYYTNGGRGAWGCSRNKAERLLAMLQVQKMIILTPLGSGRFKLGWICTIPDYDKIVSPVKMGNKDVEAVEKAKMGNKDVFAPKMGNKDVGKPEKGKMGNKDVGAAKMGNKDLIQKGYDIIIKNNNITPQKEIPEKSWPRMRKRPRACVKAAPELDLFGSPMEENPGPETPEAKADAERLLAAKEILKRYGKDVKRAGLDSSRFQARKNIIRILKAGESTKWELLRAVENYRVFCERTDKAQKFRKNAGNFFGREAVWQVFTSPGWKAPAGNPERKPIKFAGNPDSRNDWGEGGIEIEES